MRKELHVFGALALAGSVAVSGCGSSRDNTTSRNAGGDVSATPSATSATTPASGATTYDSSARSATAPSQHHSKLAGAAAGAAAGHMLGHHAVLGAAAGALIQHERNKHRQ